MRAMLAEQGIVTPIVDDEGSEYRALMLAFGYRNLPIHFFEGPFYLRVAAWDDQGPLDRALVTLLDQREDKTSPAQDAVEQDMRAVVRTYVRPD